MIYIHDNKVKNIVEFNLLHDIDDPPKRAKNLNINYCPIIHVCTNTRKRRTKFKNFRILLYSGCSYTIVVKRIVENYTLKYAVMQWQTQAGNITTNFKIKIEFTLPTLSATDVVAWKCHVDESARSRYDTILVRDLLT